MRANALKRSAAHAVLALTSAVRPGQVRRGGLAQSRVLRGNEAQEPRACGTGDVGAVGDAVVGC